jgi:hypothetical protein
MEDPGPEMKASPQNWQGSQVTGHKSQAAKKPVAWHLQPET